MNRKKKIKQTLMKKAKKANAKLHRSNKAKYVAKAEREQLVQVEQSEQADKETQKCE